MNRRWNSKLSRAFCPALVGTLVLAAWASVQAAPLANIALQGRVQGTTAWLSDVLVLPGDVVETRLVADMGPVGTSNAAGTINSQTAGRDGLQSLSLAIVQSPADTIQIDFNAPPAAAAGLKSGWGDGTGASTGTPAPRTPGGLDDLRGIRPIHSPGVFSAIDPETIFEGATFTVATAPLGGTGSVTPTWGTASGALRINNAGQLFITTSGQAGPDPLVGFTALSLTPVPEPSTIALVGMGLVGMIAFARRRRAA